MNGKKEVIDALRDCATDPLRKDHAEVPKVLLREAIAALSAQPQQDEVDPSWSLHDRVEFALRDAGFTLDKASQIATLADQQPAAVDEAVHARLVECREWFDQQADTISKGGGSTWDLLQCREQRDLCDAALAQPQGEG